MRIAVLGAGGVGGYFGGRLAAAGLDVTFVARGAHLGAMLGDGLRVTSGAGDFAVKPVKAVEDIGKVGPVDLVMICVKLWDTEQVAPSLKALAEAGATIVSFQNGVQKDEVLRRHLPAESLLGGVSYISAQIAAPGHINHNGTMARLQFGEFDGGRSARAEALLAACQQAGVSADLSDRIEQRIWEKFVFLASFSGVTSAIRQPIGPIRENPRTRTFLLEVMREIVAVGQAAGVPLAADFAQERIAMCDSLPASMAASTYYDLERGNRLETPWLNGAVVERGQALGVATPLNRAIADILELHVDGRAAG